MVRLHLRLADRSDWPDLSELYWQVFGQASNDARWRQKYMLPSPAKGGQIIVVNGDLGYVVGHLGFSCWPGRGVRGPGPVVQVMDVMVHPDWRGRMSHDGRTVFQMLVQGLPEQIGPIALNCFAYGFAGLRPFRLGNRLKLYRAVHACWACLQRPNLDAVGLKVTDWNDQAIRAIQATDRPNSTWGPDWTPEYIEWRFRSAHSAYQLWMDGPNWAVTTQWHDGQYWCVATSSELALSQMPLTVSVWRLGPWTDKGYGPVTEEPQMIASQVRLLETELEWQAPAAGRFAPWSTDVF
jgi:hypothetical protein